MQPRRVFVGSGPLAPALALSEWRGAVSGMEERDGFSNLVAAPREPAVPTDEFSPGRSLE